MTSADFRKIPGIQVFEMDINGNVRTVAHQTPVSPFGGVDGYLYVPQRGKVSVSSIRAELFPAGEQVEQFANITAEKLAQIKLIDQMVADGQNFTDIGKVVGLDRRSVARISKRELYASLPLFS